MKQDIQTILANLAVTIAEKEEDIKRLTNRCDELKEESNDLYRKSRRPEMVVTPSERQKLGDVLKDGMLRFKSFEDLEAELLAANEKLAEYEDMYGKALSVLEGTKKMYEAKERQYNNLSASLDSDKWFQIVKSLNKWRKHKIKKSKVFKENMRNRICHEYEEQIRDLSAKANNSKYKAERAEEQFKEMREQFKTLSASFNKQLKEKQSHRFQLDGEWMEMTTQELIDFYVSCHPQHVAHAHGITDIEIPAC